MIIGENVRFVEAGLDIKGHAIKCVLIHNNK